ncbi:MAG TPA: hypothetical protein VGV06_20670 [Methylomirabilota bacterium]|nr:hypothetical protein [Methylomirabilota bacterium]
MNVAPTVLARLGIGERDGMDGRVLVEALAGGPADLPLAVDTRVHTLEARAYRTALQVSTVGGRRYVDKSWRIP